MLRNLLYLTLLIRVKVGSTFESIRKSLANKYMLAKILSEKLRGNHSQSLPGSQNKLPKEPRMASSISGGF